MGYLLVTGWISMSITILSGTGIDVYHNHTWLNLSTRINFGNLVFYAPTMP